MTSEHTQHTPIETEYICVTSDNDEEEDDDDAFGDYAYAPLPDDDDDDNQLDDTSVLPANDTPSEPTLPQPLRIPPPEEPISEEDAQLIRQVMSRFQFPEEAIPAWAKVIPESQWMPIIDMNKTNK